MAAIVVICVATTLAVLAVCAGIAYLNDRMNERANARVDAAHRETIDVLRALVIPEPTREELAAQAPVTAQELRAFLETPQPSELDWTDTAPEANWMNLEVRPDVARLAPGMPVPFLNEEQTELWREEWERSDRGQGEASFEEWMGEQMLDDTTTLDYGADGLHGAPWVDPRGFDGS